MEWPKFPDASLMLKDHYGHLVEEFQLEAVNKLPSFGFEDSKLARIA